MKSRIIFLFLLILSQPLYAAPGISFHGRIVKSDNTPVISPTTQFRIRVKSPGGENCLLWEEFQTKDLSTSNGAFSITIGDTSLGPAQRTQTNITNPNTAAPFTLGQVFNNRAPYASGLSCAIGSAYNPITGPGRVLEVSFSETGAPPYEDMPPATINIVPFAYNSSELDGYQASDFLKIDPTSTYTTLTPTQVDTLVDIINGVDTQYLRSNATFGGDVSGTYNAISVNRIRGTNVVATAPTLNQVLKFDGTNWVPSTDATGTAPGDASYAAKGVVQVLTDQTTSGLTIAGGVLSMPAVGTAGTYGSASSIPVITTDAKGRVSAVVATTVDDTSKLPLNGGTMLGAINMGTQNITNATSIAATNFSGRNFVFNDNDTNMATLRAAPDFTGNYTLTLPVGAPTNGYVLSTDATGQLSWIAAGGGGDITEIVAGNGLTGDATTGVATLAVGAGTGIIANANDVAIDEGLGANKVPMVGGAPLGANGVVVANGTATALTSLNCTVNQIIKFDASGFAYCGTDDGAAAGTILNNGNTFGAAATIGTNDNFALNFETNSTVKVAITAAGDVAIGNGITPSSILDINGAVTQRGMAAPGLSPAGQGRIYFDSTSNTFRVSQNGGAYTDLVGSGGVTGSGTTNVIPRFTGATALGDSAISDNGTLVSSTRSISVATGQNYQINGVSVLSLPNASGVSVGPGANANISTGANNTAVGNNAHTNNTTGQDNTAVGYSAGSALQTGSNRNTVVGSSALAQNMPGGNDNTAIGYYAGPRNGNTNVSTSVFIGSESGFNTEGGQLNTFLGARAGTTTLGTTLLNSTAIGYNSRVDANNSLVLGGSAVNVGIANVTAPSSRLDFEGAMTVRSIAAPSLSSAGQGRIYFDSTSNKFRVSENGGAYADLVGGAGATTIDALTDAATNYATTYSMYLGSGVGNGSAAVGNTGLGALSLQSLTAGGANSAFGRQSLNSLTTGGGNTSIGNASSYALQNGDDNVAVGDGAFFSSTAGSYNVALGRGALLESATGWSNTGVGAYSGENANAGSSGNIFLGYQAGPSSLAAVNDQLYIHNAAGNPTIFGDLANRRVGLGGMTNPSTTLDIAGATTVRGMAAPALSPAGQGRIYFDSTSNTFRVSQNGSAYTDLVGATNGGTFLAADGTAGAPGFAFNSAGNSDNGMFLPAANSIAFSTAGTERLNISSTGSVGVGVAPQGWARLWVNGHIGIESGSGSYYLGGNPVLSETSAALEIGDDTDWTSVSLSPGGAERLTALSTGEVGIGITTPATALDVNGAFSMRGMAAPATSVAGRGRIYYDSTSNKFRVSENNGAYVDLVGGAGATTIDALTDAATNYSTTYNMYLGSGVGGSGTGDRNVGVGTQVMQSLTTAANNTAVGNQALQNLTSGGSNSAFGRESLVNLTTGSRNTALGAVSLYQLGAGSDNTALGEQALFSLSSGDDNVGIGRRAMPNISSGTANIGVGYEAGLNANAASSDNIFLGRFSGPASASAVSNQLYIHNAAGNPTIFGDMANLRVGLGGMTNPSTTLDILGAVTQRGIASPGLSSAGQGRIYFDSTSNTFRVSQNGGAYTDLVGGGISGLTTGRIPKAASATTLSDSIITETTNTITVAGQIVAAGTPDQTSNSPNISFNNGNSLFVAANCTTFALSNMVSGGSYTFAVQGTSGTCNFTHGGDTIHFAGGVANVPITAHTIFSFAKYGTHVYVTWVSF